MNKQFTIRVNGTEHNIEIDGNSLQIDNIPFVLGQTGNMITLDGIAYSVDYENNRAVVDGKEYDFELKGFRAKPSTNRKETKMKTAVNAGEASVQAVMPGVILRIDIEEGQKVKDGDVLMILEAMKMENEVEADQSGTVKKIYVEVGDKVEPGQALVDIE